MTIENVAVLGGGLMGSGIAESIAVAGLPVVVARGRRRVVQATRERVETSLERAVPAGSSPRRTPPRRSPRIDVHDGLAAMASAETCDRGRARGRRRSRPACSPRPRAIVGGTTIVASNTSSIPIAQLAAAVPQPERVLGLHFFSPVPS